MTDDRKTRNIERLKAARYKVSHSVARTRDLALCEAIDLIIDALEDEETGDDVTPAG